MEREERLNKYDKIISTTLVNLAIEDIRNDGLNLGDFNPRKPEHKYIFEVALISAMSADRDLTLDMNFIPYWLFRFKNWTVRKNFSRYNYSKPAIPIDNILIFMKNDLNLDDDIYKQIFEEYYEEGSKNRSVFRRKHKK